MELLILIVCILVAAGGLIVFMQKRSYGKNIYKSPSTEFLPEWRVILIENVAFYNSLDAGEKKLFEYKIQEFLLNTKIIGKGLAVTIKDRLLVAASAIVPVFKFPDWQYTNLHKVFLLEDSFDMQFNTKGANRSINGMVGTGHMEGKMVLSRNALHHGFNNETDKRNTAIHEFVHLIDKMDGTVDGVPEVLMDKQYTIPWIDMINKKVEEICEDKSDINKYGGTSNIEFFAVACEYFFERPQLLQKKHPELYDILQQTFNHDLSKKDLKTIKLSSVQRNSPCPCNSGLKYKKCCGAIHA